jgi:hypothetical protein
VYRGLAPQPPTGQRFDVRRCTRIRHRVLA